MKGMVFSTKLVVRHVLTWFVVWENFSFKTEHSDSKRLMVSYEDDSCPWLVYAICCRETMSRRSQNISASTCATKFKMLMMVKCLIQCF